MIPYDELVESLANWRGKQGLSSRPAAERYSAEGGGNGPGGVVPENDFGRPEGEGTGEVELEQYVIENEDDD